MLIGEFIVVFIGELVTCSQCQKGVKSHGNGFRVGRRGGGHGDSAHKGYMAAAGAIQVLQVISLANARHKGLFSAMISTRLKGTERV